MINPQLPQAIHDRYGVYHLSELTDKQAQELVQVLEGIGDKNIVISRRKAEELQTILEYCVQFKRDLSLILPKMRDTCKHLDVLRDSYSVYFCSCLGYITDKLHNDDEE